MRDGDSGDSVLVSSSTAGTWHPVLEVDDGTSEPTPASSGFTVTDGPAEDFTITLDLAPTMQPEYRAAVRTSAGLRVDGGADPGDRLHTEPVVPYPAGRLPDARVTGRRVR